MDVQGPPNRSQGGRRLRSLLASPQMEQQHTAREERSEDRARESQASRPMRVSCACWHPRLTRLTRIESIQSSRSANQSMGQSANQSIGQSANRPRRRSGAAEFLESSQSTWGIERHQRRPALAVQVNRGGRYEESKAKQSKSKGKRRARARTRPGCVFAYIVFGFLLLT
jgi:hypothetical protein